MKLNLYKPNAKNAGCAMSFSIGQSKDGVPSLFINAVQQSGWDDKKKIGSFAGNAKDPNKSGNFKMNANEAGEMLSSLKTRIPVVFFHKFNDDSTIISFTPWDKDRKIKGRNGEEIYKSNAFGLSISKNSSQQYKIALEAGETEVLALLLEDFIKQDLYYTGQSYKKDDQPQQAPAEKKQVEPQNDFEEESEEESIPF